MGPTAKTGFDLAANIALDEKMSARFAEITQGVKWDDEGPHDVSADAMVLLMKERYLDIDSLGEEGMRRFWAGHRGMAKHGQKPIGGLSIRFTAQYNLFSGTVAALGNPTQLEWLRESHDKGELGCFMLTEHGAGVLSGLIVDATATYDPVRDGFVLNTPTADSRKVWISQGLVATWGVFMANLIVDGKSHGAHGFLVEMSSPGVTLTSMGEKTAFNTLDNAVGVFDDVFVPLDKLLSKHARVEGGKYVFDGDKPPSFVKIGQRLLSGRLCIADAAVEYFMLCLERTKQYTNERLINTGGDVKIPISDLRYVQQTFEEVGSVARVHSICLQLLEEQFASVALKGDDIPRTLQIAINAAKVEGVDHATTALSKLRCKVGAYGLKADSPFGSVNDILYCMRFAEGDAHVLQQSITRDTIKPYMTPLGFFILIFSFCFSSIFYHFLPKSMQLRHHLHKHSLTLLVFLKRHSSKHGKLGAWYRAGNLVYKVAKAASVNLIHSIVVKRSGKSPDTEVYLTEALKECAAL